MCGIVGIYDFSGEPVSPSLLKKMTDVIAHRGPDGEGIYLSPTDQQYSRPTVKHNSPTAGNSGQKSLPDCWSNHRWTGSVGLGNRRLAIIDLSEAGKQPMSNEDQTLWITYNGEIYNYEELGERLKVTGHRFKSKTDTEVIIHAYEEWGIGCLDRFNGMFAFALWDEKRGELYLARDRYGTKPLYYTLNGNQFIFASEIKAILQHPGIKREIDFYALDEYFTFQNIYSDRTLFKGIRLLPAGSYLKLSPVTYHLSPAHYWDFDFSRALKPQDISEEECIKELRSLLERAITRSLISDVPLGTFLSGGMDSGSILAVASRYKDNLATFTCGFDLTNVSGMELAFDERRFAEYMSGFFGTRHYEVVLHSDALSRVMPALIWAIENPRLGMSYTDFYVAELAGKFRKVLLSGTGGDELFGGYPWRYYKIWNSNSNEQFCKEYYDYWQRLVSEEKKKDFYSPKAWKEIKHHSTYEIFKQTISPQLKDNENNLNKALYLELKTFLHGLLVIGDKIGMANSLEYRFPFLDNELVDFSLKIPPEYKVSKKIDEFRLDENILGKKEVYYTVTNGGKQILRKAMEGIIPPQILSRDKHGFSAPDASWYRGPLMQYAKNILLNNNSKSKVFFSPPYINRILEEHFRGEANHRLLIWSLLSFEWWNRIFFE